MSYFNLAEKDSKTDLEIDLKILVKSIKNQIKILEKANKTGNIAEVYSDELLEILKQSNLKISSFSLAENLEKKVKDSLTETKCDDVKVLKSYLPSLMFAVSKIQDKELNYYNSVVNENNKREIEKLMNSIKRKMFREYKQKEELVNSL